MESCCKALIRHRHRIDNILFSHAGLTEIFVSHFLPDFDGDIDELIEKINSFRRDELWCDASPIWARPQDGGIEMYPPGYLQVVGHTPVRRMLEQENMITLDVFSTYSDGTKFGNEEFYWVDTISREYGIIDA